MRKSSTGSNFLLECQDRGEDEIMLFNSEAAIDVFEFKWNKYAYKLHYVGAAMHLVYVMTLAVYVYFTYLIGNYGEKPSFVFPILMICGLIYPFGYDAAQLYKSGW